MAAGSSSGPAESAAARNTTGARRPLFMLSRSEAIWLVAGSLAFAFFFFVIPVFCDSTFSGPGVAPGIGRWLRTWPKLEYLHAIPGDGDRNMFAQLRWVPYYTLRHYHQWPFWNPY